MGSPNAWKQNIHNVFVTEKKKGNKITADIQTLCVLFRNKLTFLASQVGHVCHSLDSFAQARFVCQNAIEVFLVQVHQPVHADLLIVSQRAAQ